MLKNKKYLIIILVSLVLVIIIPLIMDWLIIGNNIPSNISNSDWVGFLGDYIGTIIGTIVSLVGIIITIRYTNEQNKKDRELQVRPYCSIRYVHDSRMIGTKKILWNLPIGCEPQANNGPRYESIVYIKNIGLGPAIEFKFEVDEIDDGREHYLILMQTTPETANNSINLLQSGEEGAIPIIIYFNFDPIKDEDIEEREDWGPGIFDIKSSVTSKYKNFNIVITVKYCDMFQNEYSQKITLSSSMYITMSPEGKASHMCDIYLNETTIPVKSKGCK